MHDLIIREVTLYDGTGAPPAMADVAVDGDRIAAVGAVAGAARATLDGRGLALAPGFIDVHTHDDFAAIMYPDMAFKLTGGVTSCIVGIICPGSNFCALGWTCGGNVCAIM